MTASCVVAFLLTAWLDLVWVAYMTSVKRGQSLYAGMTAATLHGSGAMVTLIYVDDHAVIAAGILGAFVGTMLAVRWTNSGKEQAK